MSVFVWLVSDSEPAQVQEMAAEDDAQDPRLARIASAIRVIPDFPKPGALSLFHALFN